MSVAGTRPAGVTRFLRRPLWWTGFVFLFVLVLWTFDIWAVRDRDARLGETFTVAGQTVAPWNGEDRLIDVRYTDPRTGITHDATTLLDNPGLLPEISDTVQLDVSTTDPSAVVLSADRQGIGHVLPLYLGAVMLSLAFWAARSHHIRRLEHLMGAGGPSFAMTGAIVSPHGGHRRWRLLLYPVDAARGAEPVCAVALVTVPSLASGCFPVEVKGVPRAFGRIAVRADDRILWSRGRALASASARRPVDTGVLVPPLASPGSTLRRWSPAPSPWWPRAATFATVVLVVLTQWTQLTSTRQQHEILERSQSATATVVGPSSPVGPDGSGSGTAVSFRVGDREQQAVLPAGSDQPSDGTVIVRYDRSDPSVVWLHRDLYPPGTESGAMWSTITLVLLPGALIGAARLRAHRDRQVAARRLLADGELDDGFPPVGSDGLTISGGRLTYHRPSPVWDLTWLAPNLGSRSPTMAFDAEALEVTGAGGGAVTSRHRWRDQRPPIEPLALEPIGRGTGGAGGPGADREPAGDRDPGGDGLRWWLDESRESNSRGSLDLVVDDPPSPRQRRQLATGSYPQALPSLARLARRDQGIRAGLSDPGAVLEFVLLLVIGSAPLESVDLPFEVLRRDPPPRDQPSGPVGS